MDYLFHKFLQNQYFEQIQNPEREQIDGLITQVIVLLVLLIFVMGRFYTQKEKKKLKIKL